MLTQDSYFSHIVNRLTMDEMSVLGILADNEANASFKAMRKQDVQQMSGLSDANYRKIIYRLDANGFINTVTGNKEHMFFITGFGLMAIEQSLEGVIYQ